MINLGYLTIIAGGIGFFAFVGGCAYGWYERGKVDDELAAAEVERDATGGV